MYQVQVKHPSQIDKPWTVIKGFGSAQAGFELVAKYENCGMLVRIKHKITKEVHYQTKAK